MKTQHGFTLIELMIVVAIIAILAAIAISQYSDYVIRSQLSEGSALIDGMKTAVAEFYNNQGRFAESNSSYGLAAPDSIVGTYVSSVGVASGVITAHFDQPKSNEVIRDQTLQFSPITHSGSIEWVCNRSSDLKTKWVPTICRN
ncbi:pilin [Arenimonas sp.]|uniref:pilin n=1 Tax=Arenimonas sp. TaxID=1872635 RepID=UPI0039E23BCC